MISEPKQAVARLTTEEQRPQQSLDTSFSRKCSTCGRAGHNSRTCLEHREGTTSTNMLGGTRFAEEPHYCRFAPEKGSNDVDDGAGSDCSAGAFHRDSRKKGMLSSSFPLYSTLDISKLVDTRQPGRGITLEIEASQRLTTRIVLSDGECTLS